MNSRLFRKKSLEKLTSPEQLNDYIRVTNPSVWVVLTAIFLLIALFMLWVTNGSIDVEEHTIVIVKSGVAEVYVSSEYAGKLKEGLVVSVGEAEGIIRTVPAQPVQITTDFDATAKSIAKMKNGDFYYPCRMDFVFDNDGLYPATVTFETVTPLSFFVNGEN
jgi:hypothetical protein